jgi:MFS superfamily sulfate permease-like transporter
MDSGHGGTGDGAARGNGPGDPLGRGRADVRAGFLVFLIALPLCLGISLASGFPALAGVFTAIVGGVAGALLSDSALAIKGPAAGLIVIVAGCVADFGGDGAIGGFGPEDFAAYRATLAVGLAAAALQVAFALLRGGVLAEFFPSWVVHGMLAAIGVIIVLKQLPVALGVDAAGEPIEILLELPGILSHANPAIALIGLVSLAIMFAWPVLARRSSYAALLPAPAVVLLFAVPASMAFGLAGDERVYSFAGRDFPLGERFLVAMPDRVFGMFDSVTTPDFSALAEGVAWKWVAMFFLIGSLESLLSAKAIDRIDPLNRRTDLDRDMLAVGVGNGVAAFVGGLPMISEIVRSRANVDNGARTRMANLWHGVFLLVCVALIPVVLHQIPLAALAAMLVYTGFRLAHPRELARALAVGREQLIAFVATIVGVLLTDLLIGVAIGIVAKGVTHLVNGVPFASLFVPSCEVERGSDGVRVVRVGRAAVFSNWIPLRRRLVALAGEGGLTVDLSGASFVDHTTMEKLDELARRLSADGSPCRVTGADALRAVSDHPHATRKAARAAS